MNLPKDVRATFYYLRREELYNTVKPYTLEFETDKIPRSNFKTHKVENILVGDIRGKEHEFTFDEHGWAVLEMDSAMTYDDFNDPAKVDEIYCRELSLVLLEYFKPMKASEIQIFDTTIRRRHSTFPYLTVDPKVQNQPAVRVHVDSTREGIEDLIKSIHGDEAPKLLEKRYMYINVWKPLKGPLHEWPLALCDADSVNPEDEFVANDTVFSVDTVRENVMVHFNDTHRWYYLSEQMPSELLIFQQVHSDQRPGKKNAIYTAVPHTSFINPLPPSEQPVGPRESIEARVLIFFDEP